MKLLLALCWLGSSVAAADEWPLFHHVLKAQRELPCEETWDTKDQSTRYVMKFDRAGRMVRREEPAGPNERQVWQRYQYDARGRVKRIDGIEDFGDSTFVTTIEYGNRGPASLHRRTVHVADDSMNGPKPEATLFSLDWIYSSDGVVRIVAHTGSRTFEDLERYQNGRLISIESSGQIETMIYDAQGRLASFSRAHNGNESATKRYFYDSKGRLEREELDSGPSGPNGRVDQTHTYRYCPRR